MLTTEYFARSANDAGEKETVTHHLQRSAELCSQFLSPIGYEDWGTMLGWLHDFGKISEKFQDVLDGKRAHVNHALPGAAVAQQAKWYQISAVIASHHSQLQSEAEYHNLLQRVLRGTGERLDKENYEPSLFGQREFAEALSLWSRDFRLKRIQDAPRFSASEDPKLSRMLFTRFLFSALVDADWSSSAEHFDRGYLPAHTGPELDAPGALDRLQDIRREKQRCSTSAPGLNALRDRLYDACLEAGKAEPGLFTLTAPTGLGKTLSLLAFSLQHCISHQKRRIIILLPYLSIIEQNCADYRQIIPQLLEIHSNVEWSEAARAQSERWDAPCIVTTNVSFFEPLFSARRDNCRHLHQLANSVLVLDEAQTLPGHLLDATLRTVKELCDHYGCTAVFSTATQPSYQFRPGLDWTPREIAPDPPQLFSATRRVTYHWEIETPKPIPQIALEMAGYAQCAVIVNLKRHARAILDALRAYSEEDSIFYLTTDLCPAHRTQMLEQVRQRLRQGLPCRLVATQCVEAGVDLDLPVVYRALAPLDAIIQAAGRCNRNGDSPTGVVKIFVPEDTGRLYPTEAYGRGALCVKALLSRHPIDCSQLSHIREYYQLLYQDSAGDSRALQDAISREDYAQTEKHYRMIDAPAVQIIVPYAGKMALYEAVRRRYDREGLTAALLSQAKEITLTSYDSGGIRQYGIPMYDRGRRAEENPACVYLLTDPECYDAKKGLNFPAFFDGII